MSEYIYGGYRAVIWFDCGVRIVVCAKPSLIALMRCLSLGAWLLPLIRTATLLMQGIACVRAGHITGHRGGADKRAGHQHTADGGEQQHAGQRDDGALDNDEGGERHHDGGHGEQHEQHERQGEAHECGAQHERYEWMAGDLSGDAVQQLADADVDEELLRRRGDRPWDDGIWFAWPSEHIRHTHTHT